ncbi:GLPGLI family protein [Chryseobacterium sp. MEBOG06]|uniref:GLPGLI family protein n=1 Tax=Chryseobacterium sp. MEBOG06 TaxID=2879938 RepID=UPI001F34D618|nr:GLPGLI family protein [Chryseobacterium sp. MEBOG06]UKB82330.1 GLPGLI family protein [Chryseobacterium sp. MEBOG06]
MKSILYSFCLIPGFITLSAQNNKAVMEVNYETKMISDSLSRDKVNIYASTLLCNNMESVYFSREAKSFYNGTSKETISTNAGAIPKYPKSVGSVYKTNEKLLVSLPVGKYIFTYEEPKLQWEILKDTKDIKGFKTRLAKAITDTGDIYFAWFTNDIEIPDGPFRFKGLSGLVLEVYNKNKTIEIYATEIKKSDELIEPLNYGNDVKTKSKQQFLEARKNYTENPSMYNGNLKIVDSNGNDRTKIMSDRLKKMNTFLD